MHRKKKTKQKKTKQKKKTNRKKAANQSRIKLVRLFGVEEIRLRAN